VVVFSRLRRRFKEVASAEGLSPSQTSVLTRLGKQGSATASVLAALEQVRPQSMAATLAALDQQGLIVRTPDPDDGRRQLVALTDAGRERFEGSRRSREEWLVRALQDTYTEPERCVIIDALALLERLTDA
jgi:DNA-binding MarR family transcriptional regulator